MKKCPQCGSQYSDVTLVFCLQDGSPLVSGTQSDTPTVVLGETETVAAHRVAEQQSRVTHVATAMPATAGRSKTPVIVVAVMVGIFVVLSVGAIAVMFLRNFVGSSGQGVSNAATPLSEPNRMLSPTPTTATNSSVSPTPPGSPTANGNVFTMPPEDIAKAKNEISQKVTNWRLLLESHDLNAYMANYADTVDYYSRRGVSSSTIRSDKARAMSLYSTIRVSVSNMSVSVSGDTATATFDKEWVFEGAGRSEGKTRAQLDFRKINSNWLITAEKDQKVYYTR